MATTKSPAVIAENPLALDAELEALIGGIGAEGLENVGADELVIPRLTLLQPTSPLSNEEGYQSGNIVNATTKENYGRSLYFAGLFYWRSRTQWAAKSDISAPIECRSSDGIHGSNKDARHAGGNCAACPLAKWVDGVPPLCTLFMNILLMPIKDPTNIAEELLNTSPVLYSAKRTATPAAQELVTMASMLRIGGKPAPLFASVYKMESNRIASEKGTYFVPKFSRHGMVPDAASFSYLRKMYTDMKAVQDKLQGIPDEDAFESSFHKHDDLDAPGF